MNYMDMLEHGMFNLPWWGYMVFTLIMTHVTILAITIFLHRHQAHRALDLHPIVSHFFRFWLWMTTGAVTKEWAATHRKHHAFSDRDGDPHSPQVFGLKKVLFEGAELYQKECADQETLRKYGNGTPDDWLERNVYAKHSYFGVSCMLAINLVLFGPIGLTIWAVQMAWMPINAAGIINGFGHYFGYRNFSNNDSSRNIIPFGILIGGEELHNNHHTFGTSAKLSYKWYEFDLGWMWIKILSFMNLATVRKTTPVLNKLKVPKLLPDLQTLEVIISNRYHLVMLYINLLKRDCQKELKAISADVHKNFNFNWHGVKHLLIKDDDVMTCEDRAKLEEVSLHSNVLKKIILMRADLAMLWRRSNMGRDELLHVLQQWCKRAEQSGIERLQRFSLRLRSSC